MVKHGALSGDALVLALNTVAHIEGSRIICDLLASITADPGSTTLTRDARLGLLLWWCCSEEQGPARANKGPLVKHTCNGMGMACVGLLQLLMLQTQLTTKGSRHLRA